MYTKKFYAIIFVSIASLPVILSLSESSESIEDVINTASKSGLKLVYSPDNRMMISSLATALSSIETSTAVTLGVLYSAIMWILTTYFPHILEAIGMKTGLVGRGIVPTLDFEAMTASLSMIPDKIAEYFHIPNAECRYRAVCETSYYFTAKVPVISEYTKKFSGAFFLNLANPYSKAWINGMMQIDCTRTYTSCEESPYSSLYNKLSLRR